MKVAEQSTSSNRAVNVPHERKCRLRKKRNDSNPWRAGCSESCKSGSEERVEKRAKATRSALILLTPSPQNRACGSPRTRLKQFTYSKRDISRSPKDTPSQILNDPVTTLPLDRVPIQVVTWSYVCSKLHLTLPPGFSFFTAFFR